VILHIVLYLLYMCTLPAAVFKLSECVIVFVMALYVQMARKPLVRQNISASEIVVHRRRIAERGVCFQRRLFVSVSVCLSVCHCVCPHDNFRTTKM